MTTWNKLSCFKNVPNIQPQKNGIGECSVSWFFKTKLKIKLFNLQRKCTNILCTDFSCEHQACIKIGSPTWFLRKRICFWLPRRSARRRKPLQHRFKWEEGKAGPVSSDRHVKRRRWWRGRESRAPIAVRAAEILPALRRGSRRAALPPRPWAANPGPGTRCRGRREPAPCRSATRTTRKGCLPDRKTPLHMFRPVLAPNPFAGGGWRKKRASAPRCAGVGVPAAAAAPPHPSPFSGPRPSRTLQPTACVGTKRGTPPRPGTSSLRQQPGVRRRVPVSGWGAKLSSRPLVSVDPKWRRQTWSTPVLLYTLFSGESTSQKKRSFFFKTEEQTDFIIKNFKKPTPNQKTAHLLRSGRDPLAVLASAEFYLTQVTTKSV